VKLNPVSDQGNLHHDFRSQILDFGLSLGNQELTSLTISSLYFALYFALLGYRMAVGDRSTQNYTCHNCPSLLCLWEELPAVLRALQIAF